MFTGGSDRLDKRADKLDAEMEQRLEARTQVLERHAQSLCNQVLALDRLQSALEFRYNGQPLQMMRVTSDATAAVHERETGNSIPLP